MMPMRQGIKLCVRFPLKNKFFMGDKFSTSINPNTNADQRTESSPKSDRSENELRPLSSRSRNTMNEILQYYEKFNIHQMREYIPTRIIKTRRSTPDEIYLFDCDVGKEIISMYGQEILHGSREIIEANAGPGVVTENLLSNGMQHIKILESSRQFIPLLASLQKKHPKQISIHNTNLFTIWKLAYQDKQDNVSRVSELFAELPHVKWEDSPGVKFIGTLPNINFIRHITMDIVRQGGLSLYGRPILYLTMPPSVWIRLTSNTSDGANEYRSGSVLFQLLFDYELVGKVPRHAFLPWPRPHIPRQRNHSLHKKQLDQELMYVTRLEAKSNLFTDVIDPEYMLPLWWFLQHHMIARTSRIIPHMEALSPGCGPNLIKNNITIFTQFGDLTPKELVNVFMEFTTWDCYHTTFLPEMESSIQRTEQLLY